MNKNQKLVSDLAQSGMVLLEEDANGKPVYKSPSVVVSTGAAILETVTSFLGMPGLGSAIAVIISTIFKKKIDRLGSRLVE